MLRCACPCWPAQCYALLCFAFSDSALLCLATLYLCYASLFFPLPCLAMLCHALIGYVLICIAELCCGYTMPCLAGLCYALACLAMLRLAMLRFAMLGPAGSCCASPKLIRISGGDPDHSKSAPKTGKSPQTSQPKQECEHQPWICFCPS